MHRATWAALLMLLLPTHHALGEGKDLPRDATLDEIQQELESWHASLSSIRLVLEERNPNQLVAYRPQLKDGPHLRGYYHKTIWMWTNGGAARRDHFSYEEGRPIIQDVLGANGIRMQSFEARYEASGDAPQLLSSLSLQRMRSYLPGPSSIQPPNSLLLCHQGHWLDELLKLKIGSHEGYEELRGVRCVKLKVGDEYVWLDPTHSHLAVKCASISSGLAGGGGWQCEVLEFSEAAKGIWFPLRGTRLFTLDPVDQVTNWELTELNINEPLDWTQFIPPQPMPETQVHDGAGSYRPADRASKRPRIIDVEEPPPTLTAIESPTRLRWRGWAVFAIAVLILALWILWPGRQDETGGTIATSRKLRVVSALQLVVCVGFAVVYGLVLTATLYLINAWKPAQALLAVEGVVGVAVLGVACARWLRFWLSQDGALERRRLQFSMQTVLLATAGIAAALGLGLHVRPLLAWRLSRGWEELALVEKVEVVPMPEAVTPAEWQRWSLGPLQLALPARFNEIAAPNDGSSIALYSQIPEAPQSVYISFPLEVKADVSSVTRWNQGAPSSGDGRSLLELELACYQTGHEDFSWMMSPAELQGYLWRLRARRKLLQFRERGWVEPLSGQELDGLLLFPGDGTAVFEWVAKHERLQGGITFYRVNGERDGHWIRGVCRSLSLKGEPRIRPASAAEAIATVQRITTQ